MALLDAAVAGLRDLPQVKLERPPRLADFALWVSACEEALGMKPGEAMAAYRINSAAGTSARARRPPRSTRRWPSWHARALPGRSALNFMPGSTPWSATRPAARCAGPKHLTSSRECA